MGDTEHPEVGDRKCSALCQSQRKIRAVETKQPTWYSAGASLPSRAFFANALVSAEMVARPLEPASLMMGVMRPVGVATATEMSAFLYLFTCLQTKKRKKNGRIGLRPDNLSEPCRIGLGDIGKGTSYSFDNEVVDA
jgi:hypothetical protein